MSRFIDLERQALPFVSWPRHDKGAWQRARHVVDIFDDVPGLAAGWRPATVRG